MTIVRIAEENGNPPAPPEEPGLVPEQPSGPTADQVAEAEGSIAARVQAKAQKLGRRTKRIPVPPDDVWEGELMLIVHPVKVQGNMRYAKLIADATDHLELLDSRTGEWDRVDGWAELGGIMGLADGAVTVGQIILAVCDSSQEVVNGLGEQVMAFIMGRQSIIEQALGEQ
jgi:hypothetical protein